MKKLLLIIAVLLLAATSCTKHYLKRELISYEATGNGAYISYYSNTDHLTHQVNIPSYGWHFQEPVQPGDSIQIFMLSGYQVKSTLTIRMGTEIVFEGSPDSTGFLSIDKKFYSEDFRLK